MRFMLRNHLERDARFEVVGEAADGPEAVERCRELEPDVVVLDVKMPTMDGMTAAAHIRTQDRSPAIALFTAFAELLDREAARELEADIVDKGAPLPWLADHLAELAGTTSL
jgi:CheY-like chemotaxis protein